MTLPLAEFLRARLDEDAERQKSGLTSWHSRDCAYLPADGQYDLSCDCGVPERTLAEVEAKRRLVDEYVAADERAKFPDFDGGVASGLDDALRILAMPYAGHDDYQDEWRPDWPAPKEQP